MLDAICISDAHLGSNNSCTKELCDFLESIHDGILATKCLIINGDLFDNIEFSRLRKKHWKVLSEIRRLSDKIKVIWVKGNHDEGAIDIVSHLIGTEVVDQYVLTSGDYNILFLHGDIFDKFITDHPILTWIADVIYNTIQKIDPTSRLAKFLKHSSKTFLRCTEIIEEKSKKLAKKLHCQFVCVGHTHYPIKRDNYYNSGCWVEQGNCTYISISNGEIELNKYLTNMS